MTELHDLVSLRKRKDGLQGHRPSRPFRGFYQSAIHWRVTNPRYSLAASVKLGKNLARLRKSVGLSQAILAERLGISTRHMQRMESGKRTPSLPLLMGLHKNLKANWEDIYAGL